MKILVIAGSNSKKSINLELAKFTGLLLGNSELSVLDLNDFELPIYSVDRENDSGLPEEAVRFAQMIEDSDGIILSLAEHNGSYSAAFKNILDWTSRTRQKLWADKKMLLMATSPGERGGITVLNSAIQSFPFMGAQVISSFSLPSFYDNFSVDGIQDDKLMLQHLDAINQFRESL